MKRIRPYFGAFFLVLVSLVALASLGCKTPPGRFGQIVQSKPPAKPPIADWRTTRPVPLDDVQLTWEEVERERADTRAGE